MKKLCLILVVLFVVMNAVALNAATETKKICEAPSKDKKVAKVYCDENGESCFIKMAIPKKTEIVIFGDNGQEELGAWSNNLADFCKNRVAWSPNNRYFVFYVVDKTMPDEEAENSIVVAHDTNTGNNTVIYQKSIHSWMMPKGFFDDKCKKALCTEEDITDFKFFEFDPKSKTVTFYVIYAYEGSAPGEYNNSTGECYVFRKLEKITVEISSKKVKNRKPIKIRDWCAG